MYKHAKTIAGVAFHMNPTMICMCEVGDTKNQWSEQQMLQVVDEIISAWKHAATEDIKLRHMFTAWGSIRDDFHRWPHPMPKPSDSA